VNFFVFIRITKKIHYNIQRYGIITISFLKKAVSPFSTDFVEGKFRYKILSHFLPNIGVTFQICSILLTIRHHRNTVQITQHMYNSMNFVVLAM
jgi:hypothetical protein